MTLSSSSHQQRKSLLPTPRLSSRIGSRRATMSNTSRIARHVPSPLLAPPASLRKTSIAQPHVPPRPGNGSLLLPEFGSRRAGAPSRIPSPLGQNLNPTPESSKLSSPIGTPRLEGRRVEAHYPTPPGPGASVETKHEHFKDYHEGHTTPAQYQSAEIGTPALLPAGHPSTGSCAGSTALATFARRVENINISSTVDCGPPPQATLTRKRSALARSLNGKENRRPQAQARIRVTTPPAAPVATIPLCPIQRTAVAQPSRALSRETLPRPLVIRKQQPLRSSVLAGSASPHSQPVRSAAGAASVVVPIGIKALMGDLDRFAKEWTGTFNDDLFDGHEDLPSNSNASTRIHPAIKPTTAEVSRDEKPATGKRLTPLGSVVSVDTSQVSSLASRDGETVNFDVTAASLSRWQHRDNTMLKGTPVEGKIVSSHPVFWRRLPIFFPMLGNRPL
jgi:hypothetical protein